MKNILKGNGEFLSLADAAKLAGYSSSGFYLKLKEHKFPAINFFGRWVFNKADLIAYLKDNPKKTHN